MAYSPLQARDPNGRWVARGANALLRSGGRKVAPKRAGGRGKKKPPPGNPAERRNARGVGVKGLKQNTVPYVRASKHSQTVGVNAGTIIPGTNKRVVFGAYGRIENTSKQNAVDAVIGKGVAKVAPKNSKRARGLAEFKKRVIINNPALRKSVGGAQIRMGTSRKGGSTSLIVRRGKHKTTHAASAKGVQKYDNRMRAIAGSKKPKSSRTQRRKAVRKKK